MRLRLLADAFAFSSLLPAAIAFALSSVASRSLDAPGRLQWALLASSGTFIVYTLDRLRDTARDRATSPDRTAFIERHRTTLQLAVVVAAIAFADLLLVSPPRVLAVTLGIGVIGLLHRRIKRSAALKAFYVSLCWTGVCVGIPWLASQASGSGGWAAGIMMLILCSNLIVSNLRDDETQLFRERPEIALRVAGALSLAAIALSFAAPPRLLPWFWVALAETLAILGFRPGERYGLLVVDGALLAGSLVALLHLRWIG